MSVLNVKPKFLYPHSRQYPFDEVAERIVRALEKRNWKVPGISVEFDTYGSGEAKFKKVSEIHGKNFKLYFCRFQGRLKGRWNDTAALHEVYIPKQIIGVYSDESGPSYYLYVGENWDEDKEWFMNSIKVHAKIKQEPRKYLRYKGNHYTKATELVSDNDLDREYSPMGDEPRRFNLDEKFKEFTSWLEEYVLNYILSFTEEEVIEDIKELVPYKGPWDTVFSLCDVWDAKRIFQGMENPNELPLEKRHASFGNGKRLVPLDIPCKKRFPEVAREGFIWCDINYEITQNSKKDDISIYVSMEMSSLCTNYIVAVSLKYANDVYVVDNAAYEEKRQQIFEAITPRYSLTERELGDVLAARAATIVPVTEYKGDYKKPMILINRELDFDEIKWIVRAK